MQHGCNDHNILFVYDFVDDGKESFSDSASECSYADAGGNVAKG